MTLGSDRRTLASVTASGAGGTRPGLSTKRTRTLVFYITAGFCITLALTVWLGHLAGERLQEIRTHASRINQEALPGIYLSGRVEAIAHETGPAPPARAPDSSPSETPAT